MARRTSTTATASESEAAAPVTTTPLEADVTLTGRLTADPVLRKTKSGLSVTTIRIAVNPPEGDATFHNVVLWRRNAEVVCQYKKKGHLVQVIGRPQERTWTGKDGNERTDTEISAYSIKFLSGRSDTPAPAEHELAA